MPPAISKTARTIMDVAERRLREGGYDSFSFRDIAGEIGVKSASVHYHFPTKEALGAALARDYTDRFLAALGPPDAALPEPQLRAYIALFRAALLDDNLMCLCGVLGAEITRLPGRVADEARRFFKENIVWLTAALRGTADAATVLASLEGALIVARSTDDPAIFERIADGLLAQGRVTG